MSEIDVEKSYCHCGMQESRRSELSNNCAKISGIFFSASSDDFHSKIFFSLFRLQNRTTRKLCLRHSPMGSAFLSHHVIET